MRNLATLLFAAAASLYAGAALPPQQHASLAAHLVEVNAQWTKHPDLLASNLAPVLFDAEPLRIREHLLRVRDQLASVQSGLLNADQRSKRARLLQRLGDYANGRRFPRNEVVGYRNPVFIDPYGTACAVGWLMIESGHGDLAKAISAGLNLGFVHEIIADERFSDPVAAWAQEHGFAADELSWIQPGYPPSLPWQPLGGGANGDVRVLENLANGHVLLAGDFTEAGGTAANHVAVWNGSGFSALGAGVEGQVTCAVEYEGDLYLGGGLLNGFSDLARWDGTSWTFYTVFDGKYPYISALHVHNGMLHAAGAVSGFAGNTDFVQRLSNGQWAPVGSAFNAPVLALATHNGLLVAGGAFTGFEGPSSPPLPFVAELEGNEWGALANGLNATVRDLLSVNGTLYAAGDLFVNIAPVFGLARLSQGGAEWEPLMPGLAAYIFESTVLDPRIERIVHHEGSIYFGGDFGISSSLMTYGYNIGRWDAIDQVAELAIPEAPVHALCVQDERLVIGGEFSTWQPHVATLDLTLDVPVLDAVQVAVSPNPTTDVIRITWSNGSLAQRKITLRDLEGRAVQAPVTWQAVGALVDCRALASGVYVVHADGLPAARIVKE